MTTSLDLLDLVVAAIVAAGTDAGAHVYKPGDWPTQDGQYPMVRLRITSEGRQSLSRSGPPEFTTTTNIQLTAEVSEPARLDDAGATLAEAALWRLKRQIEVAVINSYPLTTQIQQIASMQTQLAFNSDAATHLAGIQCDLALEWFEGPENFAPVVVGTLSEVDLTTSHYSPHGLAVHLS